MLYVSKSHFFYMFCYYLFIFYSIHIDARVFHNERFPNCRVKCARCWGDYALRSWGVIFSVSCILFQSRNIDGANNQRSVLLGASVGFACVCSMIIFVTIFRDVAASGPPIIATGLCSVLCFLARTKVR